MASQTVTITNPTGLHARPAAEFTKLAAALECDVYLEKEGKRVNAKSILGLLTLAISQDSIVDIICEGSGEEEGLAKLVDLVENLEEQFLLKVKQQAKNTIPDSSVMKITPAVWDCLRFASVIWLSGLVSYGSYIVIDNEVLSY